MFSFLSGCCLCLKIRVQWYMLMNAVQDDTETQMRGMTNITYLVNHGDDQFANCFSENDDAHDTNNRSPTVTKSTLSDVVTKEYLYLSIPFRFAVTHWCLSPKNPILRVFMALMQRQDYNHRLRYLAHFGTYTMFLVFKSFAAGIIALVSFF